MAMVVHKEMGWGALVQVISPITSISWSFCPRSITLIIFPSQLKFAGNFRFVVIPHMAYRLLQIYAHATTAMLSWHVQNFVAISPIRCG